MIKLLAVATVIAGGAAAQSGTSFNTAETWTDDFGSCGSPGLRACASLKHSCATVAGNSIRIDPYTAQDNCDLQSPACTAIPLWAISPVNPDVSFFVITDTHLVNGYGESNSDHVTHVANLNVTPFLGFNWAQAGAGFDNKALGSPILIVTTGDDTNYGQQYDLGGYRMLYEGDVSSDSLNYMTLPGLGNHDVEGQCEFANCGRRMFDYVAAAAQCVASVDSGSHNYSWNFGPFHMIQLNEWYGSTSLGSDTATGYAPTHDSGVGWLMQDLANNVGASGKPVVLFQHFGFDFFSIYHNDFTGGTSPWWSATDRQALLDIIAPYNVIGMFSGHQHQTGMYSANYTDLQGHSKILDDFTGGTGGIGGKGEFYAVRLTNDFLDVLPFEWSDGTNENGPYMTTVGNLGAGSWPGGKTWTGGAEPGVSPMPDGTPIYPQFYNPVNGCRKWIGAPLQKVPLTVSFDPTNPYGVIVKNNTGSVISGPFALQLSIPAGGKLQTVSFMGTCSQGPAYQSFNLFQLTPGQSDEITLTVSGYANPPAGTYQLSDLSVVSLGADSFLESADSVTVSAASSASVNLSTAFGKTVGFTLQVNGKGYKASVNANQTPAILTVSVDTAATQIDKSADVLITPTGYPGIKLTVTLATVSIAIDSSGGEPIVVDGTSYPPGHVFSWYPLDDHKIDAQTQKYGTDTQDRFQSWSLRGPGSVDANAEEQDVKIPFSPTSYVATYTRFYLVTPRISPAGGGTVAITPYAPDDFYAIKSNISVTATASAGYVFSTFQGLKASSENSASASVGGPIAFQAIFVPTGTYTVTTNLGTGGAETVDNVVYTGPASLTWTSGTQHTFSVPAVVSPGPGVQEVFTGWSDGVTTASRTVTAGTTTNFVANYQLQYLVTAAVSPTGGGSFTGGGWYNSGASANLLATAASGFSFSGFSGDATGATDPQNLTVSKPENIVANFQPGTPSIYASSGPRNDSDPNTSVFTFVLTNTGAGAAANTEITSITARPVIGSGTVSVAGLPLVLGTIPPGQAASQTIDVSWPSSATRVAFTVSFSANGGSYQGQTTFYVIR
jgi:hypothetical protein